MERLREIKIKGWVHRAVYLFLGKGKDGIILGEGQDEFGLKFTVWLTTGEVDVR